MRRKILYRSESVRFVERALKTVPLLFLVLAAACGGALQGNQTGNPVAPSVSGQELTLSQAWTLWQQHDIRHYRYRIIRQCFCLPAYTRPMWVTVAAGEVTGATYVDDRSPVPAKVVGQLRTVEEWFGKIAQAKDGSFHRIKLSFDHTLGFPREIWMDRSERVADDEQRIRIEQLEILSH